MTIADVLRQLEQIPDGSLVPVGWVRAQLQDAGVESATAPDPDVSAAPATWREKLWTVPDQTRLGRKELAEAVGRPISWVNRRTSSKSGYRQIPHRLHDGATVFVAGEVREWLRQCEEVVVMPVPAVVSITRGKRVAKIQT